MLLRWWKRRQGLHDHSDLAAGACGPRRVNKALYGLVSTMSAARLEEGWWGGSHAGPLCKARVCWAGLGEGEKRAIGGEGYWSGQSLVGRAEGPPGLICSLFLSQFFFFYFLFFSLLGRAIWKHGL